MSELNDNAKNLDHVSTRFEGLTKPLRILSFLQELPETEIHIHMEAMLTVETALELIKKNNLQSELEIHNEDQLYERFQVNNINDFIQVFHVLQRVHKTEEDFRYLVRDVKNYCKRNNIYYIEVFLAPTQFIKNGLDFAEMVWVINDEINRKDSNSHEVDIKLLIDVSRNYGETNAMRNLDLAIENKTGCIIGIGIGGAENLPEADARYFKRVFEKAVNNGLKVVAHAGEVMGAEFIWETIKELNIARIGHGISAVYDEKLMNYLKETQIPLEICPTSNIFTQKFVKKLSEHPIRTFYDRGLNVTVNCDDPSIFGVELNDEYLNIYKHCGFTLQEILQLIKNNLYATFMPKEDKDKNWLYVMSEVERLRVKYNIDINEQK